MFAVAAVLDLYFTIISVFGTDKWSIEDPGKLGERALLCVAGPILGTNLLSTGLIAWKAWCALLATSDSRRLFLTMTILPA